MLARDVCMFFYNVAVGNTHKSPDKSRYMLTTHPSLKKKQPHKLKTWPGLLPANTQPLSEPCPVCVKHLLTTLPAPLLLSPVNCTYMGWWPLWGKSGCSLIIIVCVWVCEIAKPGHAALGASTLASWCQQAGRTVCSAVNVKIWFERREANLLSTLRIQCGDVHFCFRR